MKASMMLPLRISRTKKRLSDDRWLLYIATVGILGVLILFTYALRPTILSAGYGLVEAEIPIIAEPIEDPTHATYEERSSEHLGRQTPTIILTRDEFIFGDINAFSANLAGVRDKFSVKHRGGAPDIPRLLKSMAAWEKTRAHGKNGTNDVVVFIPAAEIPAPIVIETMAGIRSGSAYKRIVLAAGLE